MRLGQEDLAMAWLRDARPGPGRTFSDIATPVLPALERGLLTAAGERKADLLAHIGWADFLRSRDGVARDPEPRYREAVQLDPRNPYARANLGHWVLWRNGGLDAAKVHFAAALDSGRARAYVRRMQLSALGNAGNDDEFLRVVNAMCQNKEPVDERTRVKLFSMYASAFGKDEAGVRKLLTVAPPADQLATFQSLFYEPNFDQSKRVSRDVYLATLQEAAGRPDEALGTLRAVRPELNPNTPEHLVRLVHAGIRRLSKPPTQASGGR